jgi:hypothetical protein
MIRARRTEADLPEARVLPVASRLSHRSWTPAISLRSRTREALAPLAPSARIVAAYVVGLWPLIAVTLFFGVMIWSAGYQQP